MQQRERHEDVNEPLDKRKVGPNPVAKEEVGVYNLAEVQFLIVGQTFRLDKSGGRLQQLPNPSRFLSLLVCPAFLHFPVTQEAWQAVGEYFQVG